MHVNMGERTAAADPRDELSLVDLLALLWRRRHLLLGSSFLGIAAGVLLLAHLPERYRAETLLLIQPTPMAGDAAVVSSATLDRDSVTVDSQVAVLASRSLARKVIERLNLADDPELDRAPSPSLLLSFRRWPGLAPKGRASAAREKDRVVENFLDRLSVERRGKSRVIAVRYESGDPGKAARVAHALAELYIRGQLTAKFEASRRATAWLEKRLRTLETQLRDAEHRLVEFRERNPEEGTTPLIVAQDRLADLERQHILAKAEREGLESRYRFLKKAMQNGRGEGSSLIGTATPLLRDLEALKAQLIRRESELLGRYGRRHPAIVDLRREKKKIDQQIRREQRAIATRFQAELEEARTREESLARELAAIKNAAGSFHRIQLQRKELEREVELARRLYENFLGRLKNLSDRDSMVLPDARIISDASPPEEPASPRPRMVLSITIGTFFGFGLLLVYAVEKTENGFHTARSVTRTLGLPVHAVLPELPRPRGAGRKIADHVLDHPRSRYAEALREILATLSLAQSEPGTVLLVASSLPREGKTLFSLSLGRLAAREGLRVLLIDADLRRPRLAKLLGLEDAPGLSHALEHARPLSELVRRDPKSELQLLTGSRACGRPAGLLGSKGFERILDEARSRFDLVLIDSAPLAAVADARLVGLFVDHILLLVRYRRTARGIVERTAESLAPLRAKMLGVVLSRADPAEQARYGYGDALLAGRRLAAYYSDS